MQMSIPDLEVIKIMLISAWHEVVLLLSVAGCENFCAYEYENGWHFLIYQQRKFHAQLS